ncbi:hypothetical protein [Angustibacter luteus]|uniref:Uncharacterized protein n=1 Tax=Angustibacter luteus TaxID=658456 RepID=A0ABW1JAB5_9ACTN
MQSIGTPTALVLPVVAATAVTFAVHHEAPDLLRQRSRRTWPIQLTWGLLVLLPGAALAAAGAAYSGQISLAAGERNYLLFAAVALVSLRFLAPGATAIPCAVTAFTSLVLLSAQPLRTPQAWNWLVQSGTDSTQLLVAAGCCLLGLLSLVTQQPT